MTMLLLLYLIFGVVVLIVGLSQSNGRIGGGSPITDILFALLIVLIWPVVIIAL